MPNIEDLSFFEQVGVYGFLTFAAVALAAGIWNLTRDDSEEHYAGGTESEHRIDHPLDLY